MAPLDPDELAAFLADQGAEDLGAYLGLHGADPLEALEARLRWALWSFRDPRHANEARYLIANQAALREEARVLPPVEHTRPLPAVSPGPGRWVVLLAALSGVLVLTAWCLARS